MCFKEKVTRTNSGRQYSEFFELQRNESRYVEPIYASRRINNGPGHDDVFGPCDLAGHCSGSQGDAGGSLDRARLLHTFTTQVQSPKCHQSYGFDGSGIMERLHERGLDTQTMLSGSYLCSAGPDVIADKFVDST